MRNSQKILIAVMLLTTACNSDSSDEPQTVRPDQKEISLNPSIGQMTEGTRTTTYDSETIKTGGFTCAAYEASTTTAFISPTTINWVTSQWQFSDGSHFWPTSGDLDFFAYKPATAPSYITGPTYTTARSPQFTCDMNKNADAEFIWALTTGQNKTNASSGVNLVFKHPFALVTFQRSESSSFTINSVSIAANFYQTGTCTFDGTTSTWTDTSGSVNPSITFGVPILVIPGNYGSLAVSAEVTWTDWSTVTKTLSTSATFNLAAGNSYTYTINVTNAYGLVVTLSKYTEQW